MDAQTVHASPPTGPTSKEFCGWIRQRFGDHYNAARALGLDPLLVSMLAQEMLDQRRYPWIKYMMAGYDRLSLHRSKPRGRLPRIDRQAARELISTGATPDQVATKLGCSAGAIRTLQRNGELPVCKPPRPPLDYATARRMLEDGKRIDDVSWAVGYSRAYIIREIQAGRLPSSTARRGPNRSKEEVDRLTAAANDLIKTGATIEMVCRSLGVPRAFIQTKIHTGRIQTPIAKRRPFVARGTPGISQSH